MYEVPAGVIKYVKAPANKALGSSLTNQLILRILKYLTLDLVSPQWHGTVTFRINLMSRNELLYTDPFTRPALPYSLHSRTNSSPRISSRRSRKVLHLPLQPMTADLGEQLWPRIQNIDDDDTYHIKAWSSRCRTNSLTATWHSMENHTDNLDTHTLSWLFNIWCVLLSISRLFRRRMQSWQCTLHGLGPDF